MQNSLILAKRLAHSHSEILTKSYILTQLSEINNVKSPYQWEFLESTNQNQTNKLKVQYKFHNFPSTWEFLNLVALKAHKLKHHPEITNVFRTVNIELTTHDLDNKVSQLDLDLAKIIHEIYLTKYLNSTAKLKFKDFLDHELLANQNN